MPRTTTSGTNSGVGADSPEAGGFKLPDPAMVGRSKITLRRALSRFDAAAIHDHGQALGHMPIIVRNFRAQREAPRPNGPGSA